MFTKEQLQPIHNRIYEIIGNGYLEEDDEIPETEFDDNSVEDYNARITSEAIYEVLEEVEAELVKSWFNFPEVHMSYRDYLSH